MAKNITVGIDVGTYQVKVLVAERNPKGGPPKILGTGYVQSKGLRHGYIINSTEATRSIRSAINQAEKESGVSIRKAYLSIGGVGLEEVHSTGEAIVSRADSEVTNLDIDKAIKDSEEKVGNKILNRRVIHAIPIQYKIDDEKILGRAEGMKGNKLEVDTLFIVAIEQHMQDLISVIEGIGVDIIDVMASPIAASFVTLTKAQKIAGVVLANIGAETVSIAVFEDNIPISIKVFPIGSTNITNDIALGLQVSLHEAEDIKVGKFSSRSYPNEKLDKIIVARLSAIFSLIEAHLKKIERNGLLPAGIVITGGGSGVATIEDLAKGILKLPSRRSRLKWDGDTKIKDSSWAVAYGLCIFGFGADQDSPGLSAAKRAKNTLLSTIRQFLP